MQQNNLQAKFRLALCISQMDKESRQKDKLDPKAKQHDFVEVPVEHNGKVETIYMKEEPQQLNEDAMQIQHAELQLNIGINQKQESYLPRKEGILLKKSPHFLQGWQERFAICDNSKFSYYLLDQRTTPFGILDFNIMSYELQEVKNNQGGLLEFVLVPHGCNKVFQFKGTTMEETKIWYEVIKANKASSDGGKQLMNNLAQYTRFWRTDRISAEQFVKQVNTADILLFRGTATNCIVQRTFTGSEYDHAALLLRFTSGSLYILEATGYYGVGLCSWDSMIRNKWYELYDKIMVRRLEITRDTQFLTKVQQFTEDYMGKKYSCSPQKLLKLKSTIQDVNKKQKKEDRTFFCSELVAALYKELGLLPLEKSAAQYWPGSFSSENKQLKVLKGNLLPEQLIDFSQLK